MGVKVKVKRYQVELEFTEPVLGTVPKNKEVYAEYIATRARELADANEEVQTVEEVEEKGWTGFHMEDGKPFFYDYWIKGFFKSACKHLRKEASSKSSKVKAYRQRIDGNIFVYPRRIFLQLNGQELGVLERPLRANTAQGPRVALARSDTAAVGTKVSFEVVSMGVPLGNIEEWLWYGQFMGLGQWRSGGYGRFMYEISEA